MEKAQEKAHAPGTELAGAIGELAKILKPEATGLIRTSRQPVQIDYPYNPKNYDIRAEADTLAKKKGHELSQWVTADANVPDFFQAQCLDCGGMATARWRPKPANDNTDGEGQFPELAGDCLTTPCSQLRKKYKGQEGTIFRRRSAP